MQTSGQFRQRPLVGPLCYSRHFGEDKVLLRLQGNSGRKMCDQSVVRVWYSRGCHTFRPSHLPWFEHPKYVCWWVYIFKFLIRQFPSRNLFVPLIKMKSSLESNTEPPSSTNTVIAVQKPVACSRALCCLGLYHCVGSCLRRMQYSRTPLTRINWDCEPSGYTKNPDN
jgi:hypothetical protein